MYSLRQLARHRESYLFWGVGSVFTQKSVLFLAEVYKEMNSIQFSPFSLVEYNEGICEAIMNEKEGREAGVLPFYSKPSIN